MASENSLEFQLKSIEKGMGTLVKAFKDLKANVKALEDKVDNKINDEIKDIKKNQKVLEDLMKANSDAEKVVKNVILGLQKENQKAEQNKVVEKTNNELIKWKFYNGGHCKYKTDCKFYIPVRFANSTLKGFNVTKKIVRKDTQKSVNGGRGQVMQKK